MQLPFIYQVTQYDPADFVDAVDDDDDDDDDLLRVRGGCYQGPLESVSDQGPREAAYLRAVVEFARDSGVRTLTIREPEAPVDDSLLPVIGGAPISPDLAGYTDGASVPIDVGAELVRGMLRGDGYWCRLEVEGRFFVHNGWDQYLYIGSAVPCERAVDVIGELGLFPVRITRSPYTADPEDMLDRRTDEAFWAEVGALATRLGQVLVEVARHAQPSAFHRITPRDVEALAASVPARALVSVWPDLSTDVGAVLSAVADEDGDVADLVVWQAADGTIVEEFVDSERPGDVEHVATSATAAAVHLWDEKLTVAVAPDEDGVLRARWTR